MRKSGYRYCNDILIYAFFVCNSGGMFIRNSLVTGKDKTVTTQKWKGDFLWKKKCQVIKWEYCL